MKKFIIIILILIILISVFKLFNINNLIMKPFYPKKYSEFVEKYSREYNIDSLLVYSIIKAESNFNKDAESSSGAKGLMQLMDATALEISNEINEPIIEAENLKEPEKNIMIGVKYYSDLYEKYNKNMLLALAAYNAGIGNVDNWISTGIISENGSDIENIPFKETNMYVRKIINSYKIYQDIYKK